ncbi:hypothetical protein BME42_05265 [Klebsiella pneumoniae]|nr:hypothetical protein BME42_05265 [Klebsiella pneumoniae]
MTSLKTSIKTITYLSDICCLEIQGASLWGKGRLSAMVFSISATSVERRFWTTQIPGHSRV